MSKPAPPVARIFASAARQPWRWLAVVVAAAALVAGCEGLQTQQRKWIFQARPSIVSVDELARLSSARDMQDVWIDHVSAASGRRIRLHGLWAPNAAPGSPVLLYLHGARRDVGGNAFRIGHMRELGFSVLAIDYRGFGASTDELPSQDGVVEDAAAAWHWLAREHAGRPRYVFGHSLGGAVAVQLAAALADAPATQRPRGVIVEGTFTSVGELFRTFKWGWLPITALITERFDSLAAVSRLSSPLLVVHGSHDSLVPSRFGRALFERATVPKRFVLVEGGTHSSTGWRGAEAYRAALRELFGVGDGA